MRCKVCNKSMQSGEIKWNKKMKDFEVCGSCLFSVREQMEAFKYIPKEKEKEDEF